MNAGFETALIGGLILFPDYMPQAAALIAPEDFAGHETRDMYEELQGLAAEGKPIDPLTVTAALVRRGVPEDVAQEDVAAAMTAAPLAHNLPS